MSVSFQDTFRNRPVFLTGHTGFKGSWLTLWLQRLGAQVTGYALAPPSVPSNFVSSQVSDALAKNYHADVRDFSVLQGAMKASQPEVVIHLAAQALVRQSYEETRQTFEVNVQGTVNVLEAVRGLERPCTVLIVTSDKCYENTQCQQGHEETDALGGNDPYSASKAAAELVTTAYRRSFFSGREQGARQVKVASVRAGNVMGGGDWAADRIVPDGARALSQGQAIVVRNPESVRPWQHVLEPLCGYLMLAAKMVSSNDRAWCSGWNFGPRAEDEKTVAELAETFCQAWGHGKWRGGEGGRQLGEEAVLRLSSEKARNRLGWQPRWTFAEGVTRTARWYRAFYANPRRSTRDLCIEDIADYEARRASSGAARPEAAEAEVAETTHERSR